MGTRHDDKEPRSDQEHGEFIDGDAATVGQTTLESYKKNSQLGSVDLPLRSYYKKRKSGKDATATIVCLIWSEQECDVIKDF